MNQKRLRIASYNIHKGFSLVRRRLILAEIRSALREIRPDLVFLQEVQGEHRRHAKKRSDWPSKSQSGFLAEEIFEHEVYGKNAVYTHGHHGNAILSRYPITKWRNTDISTNPFERRGMLQAELDFPWPVIVACCHLDLFEGGRRKQAAKLKSLLQPYSQSHSIVLAGDFNDWRGQVGKELTTALPMQEVFEAKEGENARSFPSFFPLLKLDRIYLAHGRAVSARCLTDPPFHRLSDHALLLAEVELTRPG